MNDFLQEEVFKYIYFFSDLKRQRIHNINFYCKFVHSTFLT